MEGVPANVRAKRSKMLRGLSVKKRRAFYESQLGSNRTVLSESEKRDTFTVLLKITCKTPWNPELVNTLHYINLTKIDEDGSVRMDFVSALVLVIKHISHISKRLKPLRD
jgi:threonylcarbamoyladenosine tRNA methylthiotransferase MtaB